jgi:hypothetical protein
MARFVGLDVSQKLTSICVVDDAGRRLWRGQCHSEPEPIERAAPQASRSINDKSEIDLKSITRGPARGGAIVPTTGRSVAAAARGGSAKARFGLKRRTETVAMGTQPD